MKEPTWEELLEIAKQSIQVELNDYYKANIEQTAQAIVEGTTAKDENWNLALVKMLLMTNHRVRELRAGST